MGTYSIAPGHRLSALLSALLNKVSDLLTHPRPHLFAAGLDVGGAVWKHDEDVAVSGWLLEEAVEAAR